VTGLAFYDWETLELVRRIEIQPRHVFWSENGELVCLATEESYFILKYDSSVVAQAHETKEGLTEDGVEDAFAVSLLQLDDMEPRSGSVLTI
jgi:coatomer subunit beta'